MASRLELHDKLVEILGSNNVYYQPPESLKLHYPCIIYSLTGIDNTFANDGIYLQKRQYEIVVVSFDPDTEISDKMSKFPYTSYSRHYNSDNLNHDVFKTYF